MNVNKMESVVLIFSLLISVLFLGYTLLILSDILQMSSKGWRELPYIFLQRTTITSVAILAILSMFCCYYVKGKFKKFIIGLNAICILYWLCNLAFRYIEIIE